MKSELERKWWFVALTSALAGLATTFLMNAAGIFLPHNFAQWALFFICIGSLKSGFSLAGWFLVVCMSPSHKELNQTK